MLAIPLAPQSSYGSPVEVDINLPVASPRWVFKDAAVPPSLHVFDGWWVRGDRRG